MVFPANDVAMPLELYRKWERQYWRAHSIDFAGDRRDWLRLTDHERWQWYWLAGFAHFRQSESDAVIALAKLLPHLRLAEQQYAVAAQIADEGRHAFFFKRFHDEVVITALPSAALDSVTISPVYQNLFVDSMTATLEKAIAQPTQVNLAAVVFHFFIILEGCVGLASFAVIRRLLTKTKLFPGLLEGITHANRDEMRHVQLGIVLLKDMFEREPAAIDSTEAYLQTLLPLISDLMRVRPDRKAVLESLDINPFERRRRAFDLLRRHLKTLGIDEGVVKPWAAYAVSDDACYRSGP